MVNKCVAYGCKNSPSPTVTLHFFPKDAKFHAIWRRKVQTYRGENWRPTPNSSLCSEHFEKTTENFYEEDLLRSKMGLPRRGQIKLKPTAIPTIFAKETDKKTRKKLVEKHERQQMLDKIENEETEMTEIQSTENQKMEVAEALLDLSSSLPADHYAPNPWLPHVQGKEGKEGILVEIGVQVLLKPGTQSVLLNNSAMSAQ